MPPTSMVCPSCRNLIHVDEKKCPHCGAFRPGLWGFGPALSKLFGSRIDILALIPTTCVALYVVSLILDLSAALQVRGGIFGMLSPGGRALVALGMTGNMPGFRPPMWTLLTANYLHGGLLHILFNVLWIRQLGPEVGTVYGPSRYFIIFTASGATGFLLSNVFSGAPTVGASAAIFGLFAALIVYGRWHGGTMMASMTRQVWQWAILLFLMGFMMSRVNNFAHLGGFFGGWVASRLLVSSSGREGRLTIILALLLIVATGAAFVLNFITYWPILLAG